MVCAPEPAAMMRATPDSPRMFESDFIDLFSRTHPLVVPALFVPGCLFSAWGSVHYGHMGYLATVGLIAAGFAFWTVSEYWLHRLFFHWEPPGGPAPSASTARGPALHHVALGTPRVEELSGFYAALLGIPELRRHHYPDGALRSVWFELSGVLLMLEHSEAAPVRVSGVGSG